MNITFLIGNGFDVGLGLKTRYQDFYPHFTKEASWDNYIKMEMVLDYDFKNWSDLEVSLGKITEKISVDKAMKFVKDKIELDNLLKHYLQKEQKRFKDDSNRYTNVVHEALKHFRKGNNENEKALIQSILGANKAENYVYECIAFNYTDVIDRVWGLVKNVEIGKHAYNGRTFKEIGGDVLHIHGTLHDNEMIVGVNDESQITNENLAKNRYVKLGLIKPNLNSEIGQNKIQKAKAIIDNSSIICVYGMSIGITDNMWWEYIGEWLAKSTLHVLIIYNYEPHYSVTHPLSELMHREGVRNKFLENSKLSDEKKRGVESRIIVYDNQNIFEIVDV